MNIKTLFFFLAIIFATSSGAQQLIPFCGFGQLSETHNKPPCTHIRTKPRLIKTRPYIPDVATGITPITHKQNCYKTWQLSKQYHICHQLASNELTSIIGYNDTLIIADHKFSLQQLLFCKPVIPAITNIWLRKEQGYSYLIFKVIDGGNGQHYSCSLLAFNVTDTNHIICLNERTKVFGTTLLMAENLVTDLDNDGNAELNLGDNLTINSYALQPNNLAKSTKHVAIVQKGNYFYIDRAKSDWYFDLSKNAPAQRCKLSIDHSGCTNLYID